MRIHAHVSALAVMVFAFSAAHAGDAAKGQSTFEANCTKCHEAADFEGETQESINGMVKDWVSGKKNHKAKIKLTDEEIASIAAYLGK